MNKKMLENNYKKYLNKVAKDEFCDDYSKGHATGMLDAYGDALGYDPDEIYQHLKTEKFLLMDTGNL